MEKKWASTVFPSSSTKYNWCWKIWSREKNDRVGKKLTGYFFLPGKKMTSQFLPRGRNGPAWSFPGERLAGGKNWPLHRSYHALTMFVGICLEMWSKHLEYHLDVQSSLCVCMHAHVCMCIRERVLVYVRRLIQKFVDTLNKWMILYIHILHP